jgi:non-heme chloroperoxidase
MQAINVKTPDGISLAAQDWGNPGGREILFIHGFNQAHLSWLRQVNDRALAQALRMVTFDLRGHGMSDKPVEPERYAADKIWGDDIAAVIDAAGLKRPVLVGWSFGGRIIGDYLRTHGASRIAGINYVNARTVIEPAMFGKGRENYPNMQSEDLPRTSPARATSCAPALRGSRARTISSSCLASTWWCRPTCGATC